MVHIVKEKLNIFLAMLKHLFLQHEQEEVYNAGCHDAFIHNRDNMGTDILDQECRGNQE